MTHDLVNANGPSALMFAWMGPFIGALIRPWADGSPINSVAQWSPRPALW